MTHTTKTIWISAAILGFILVVGVVGVSIQADEPITYRPNDRANHHPVHPNN